MNMFSSGCYKTLRGWRSAFGMAGRPMQRSHHPTPGALLVFCLCLLTPCDSDNPLLSMEQNNRLRGFTQHIDKRDAYDHRPLSVQQELAKKGPDHGRTYAGVLEAIQSRTPAPATAYYHHHGATSHNPAAALPHPQPATKLHPQTGYTMLPGQGREKPAGTPVVDNAAQYMHKPTALAQQFSRQAVPHEQVGGFEAAQQFSEREQAQFWEELKRGQMQKLGYEEAKHGAKPAKEGYTGVGAFHGGQAVAGLGAVAGSAAPYTWAPPPPLEELLFEAHLEQYRKQFLNLPAPLEAPAAQAPGPNLGVREDKKRKDPGKEFRKDMLGQPKGLGAEKRLTLDEQLRDLHRRQEFKKTQKEVPLNTPNFRPTGLRHVDGMYEHDVCQLKTPWIKWTYDLIEKAPVEQNPFEHLVLRNFFHPDLYACMQHFLPPQDQSFDAYQPYDNQAKHSKHEKKQKWRGVKRQQRATIPLRNSEGHYVMGRGPPMVKGKGWLNQANMREFWEAVSKRFTSLDFQRLWLEKFSLTLSLRFARDGPNMIGSHLDKTLHQNIFGFSMGLAREADGYSENPRTDPRERVVSIMAFLPPNANHTGQGDEAIYSSKTGVHDYSFPKESEYGSKDFGSELQKVLHAPYQPNTVLAFAPCQSSWHGLEHPVKMKGLDGQDRYRDILESYILVDGGHHHHHHNGQPVGATKGECVGQIMDPAAAVRPVASYDARPVVSYGGQG